MSFFQLKKKLAHFSPTKQYFMIQSLSIQTLRHQKNPYPIRVSHRQINDGFL